MEWKAFDLRPDTPPEGIPRYDKPGEHRIGALVDGHLGEMAQEAGLVMKRAPITAYTRPAMEAAEYAKSQDKFDEFHLALFKAYWEDGKNLGDRGVLQEIASQVGMNPEGLDQALREGHYAQIVEDQVEFARQIGITGIPAFVIGRYLFMGAQSYDFFKVVMERALQDQTSAQAEAEQSP